MNLGSLQKPYYHDPSPIAALRQAALFGLFVFLFLTIFQPFGIRGMPGNFLSITAGFGAVTAGVMVLLNVLAPQLLRAYFEETRWTVGREVAQTMLNLWAIGVGNFLFFSYAAKAEFSAESFWGFQFITVAVGVFPVVLLILARERRSRTTYEKAAEALTDELPQAAPNTGNTIAFQLQAGQEPLTLLTSELRCLQAADNYVYVHFFRGAPQRCIVRSTLKTLEADLSAYPHFLRCHKSYIVNLDAVTRISGNAQGYKLHVQDVEEPIPVSRQHNATIKERLAVRP
jgi:DNA-binding LytR/AlgR family response regulator